VGVVVVGGVVVVVALKVLHPSSSPPFSFSFSSTFFSFR
jgi:hypothetical protein